MIELIGKKCAMTTIFLETGNTVPITIIYIETNFVTKILTKEKNGYSAIQISSVKIKKQSKIVKPIAGHFAKSKVYPCNKVFEFKINSQDENKYYLGQEIDLSFLNKYKKVDVTGNSKGKGFQGCVKRHNFKTQDATHGNSLSHRVHGSTGQNQTPGRVFKNKKMAGQMGNKKVTVQNLQIFKIDLKNKLLLVTGSIPGANDNYLIVKPSKKLEQ